MKKISGSIIQFFSHSSDLPLEEGPASRFVPWIIAFMIYLTCLVTVGMLLIQSSIHQWDTLFSRTITIEIPYTQDLSPSDQAQRLKNIQSFLQETLEIESIQPVDPHKIEELLEPWLGKGNITSDLPLPTLIDVRVSSQHDLNLETLSQHLQALAPGATLEDHGHWRQTVIRLFKSGEYLGFWLSLLIVVATIMTITFSTHTELTIHRKIVDILHTVGANDTYVAWQFQRHAIHLGIQAATISLILIGSTLFVLSLLFYQIDSEMLKSLKFNFWILLSIPVVILSMMGIMIMTARFSILKALKQS